LSKLPAIQFYPGDWRKDVGVQSLSFHDRGVWFEMLMLMHESENRGLLILNGAPMEEEALARLLGLNKQVLGKTLARLLSTGVAGRDEQTGALMSRRMVRDEYIRQVRTTAGKNGGNPVLVKQNEDKSPDLVNQIPTTGDKQKSTPSSSSSLSTTKPEKQKRAPSAFSLPPWISQVTWDGFEETRRRMRKPMTDAARALIIKRLDKFRQDGQDPEAMVENAIAHGWISVWPIEEGRNGTEVNRSGKDYQGNSSNGDDAGSEDRSGLFEALYGKTG